MGKKLDFMAHKLREKSNRNFLPFYKFPTGRTDLRIVPAPKGADEDDWFLVTGMHYNFNDKTPIYCPHEHNMQESPCAICDMVAEFRKEGMNDEAAKISVRRRVIIRAIIRGQEDKGVQIVNLPVTVFTAIYEILQDVETWDDVLSPGPKGRDIRIIKTGQNLNTEYQVQALPKTCPMLPTQGQVTEVMDSLTPILTLIPVPTSEEVAAIVQSKMGYVAFGAPEEEPVDEEWEASSDDTTEEVEDSVGEVPFGPTDTAWLEDGEEEEAIPDLTAVVKRDRAAGSVKTNLAAELGKRHKVKG